MSTVDSTNAESFVLTNGGSQGTATQFLQYCLAMEQAPVDHAASRTPWWGYSTDLQDKVESLWECSGISTEGIVRELGELFPPHGFHTSEALATLYEYTIAGTKLGLSIRPIQETIAVELAIQSGEIPLPWSQEEVEQGCWNGGPYFADTQALMATHPEFTAVACGWAYHKNCHMFYMLHTYRTDGLT